MDQNLLKAVWNEVITEAKRQVNEKLPGEMTIKEFMQQTGLSRGKARGFLETQVERGVLSRRVIYLREAHSTCCLYAPVDPPMPPCEKIPTPKSTN